MFRAQGVGVYFLFTYWPFIPRVENQRDKEVEYEMERGDYEMI